MESIVDVFSKPHMKNKNIKNPRLCLNTYHPFMNRKTNKLRANYVKTKSKESKLKQGGKPMF